MTRNISLVESPQRHVEITIGVDESKLTWSFDYIRISENAWQELTLHGFSEDISSGIIATESNEAREIRDRIATIVTTIKRTVELLQINREYEHNNDRFIDYANQIIKQEQEYGNSKSRVEKYTVSVTKFNQFLCQIGKEDLLFRNLHSDIIDAFNNKLIKEGLKESTIAFYNRMIVAIYNRGVNEGKSADNKPFANVATQYRQ